MNKRLELVKEEKAITLVVLVITIVILLILAGISISALTNTGLFGKAKEAKEKTQNAEKEQNKILGEYEHALDQYDEKKLVYKVNNGTIKIGDYVSYIPDTASTENILKELKTYSGSDANTTETLRQEELKWRVLDVKEGKVRLISATPTTRNNKLYLYGAKGYNNAVYLLDKTCYTLYNNSKLVSNVQNIKIEDIQEHLKYDYKQEKNEYVDTKKYGGTKEYTVNINYPNLYAKEKKGWVDEKQGTRLDLSEQTEPIDETKTIANKKIKITQTYWGKYTSSDDFENGYYELFLNNGNNCNNFWISSRCVQAYSNYINFDIRYAGEQGIYAGFLCRSFGDEYILDFAYRPVITLNSNVSVISGNGKIDSPYELK